MTKSIIQKSFFLIWAITSIFIVVCLTNRVDFIHGFVFQKDELLLFPLKLARIEPLGFVWNLLRSFLYAALLSVAYGSFGSIVIWQLIKGEVRQHTILSWAAVLCSAFVTGHAVFSIIFIYLAAIDKFTAGLLIFCLAVGFIIGLPFLRKLLVLLPDNRKIELGEIFESNDYKWTFVLSITVFFLCLMYTSSRISYDAVAFYFSDEKITALTNHIQFFQNDVFVASSFQAGISYAALIKISGEQAARVYPWINALVIIVFSLAIGEKVGLSKRARVIVLALVLTSTAFLDLTGDGKVEIIGTTAAMASVYWAINNADRRAKAVFFLIGLFAGVAIASRIYNAFLVPAFIGIYYLTQIYSSKRSEIPGLLKSLFLWVGAGIFCIMISHLYINWIILGDAFAFLKNFHALDSTDKWYWTIDPKNIWVIRLLYPLTATFINSPQSDGSISPLVICALAGILLRIKRGTQITKPLLEITVAAIIALVFWLCIIYTVFEIRYVLFLWVLLFMPIAVTIENFLSTQDILLKRFIQLLLVFLLSYSAIRVAFISIDTYSPVDELGNPHCYDYSYCDSLEPINKSASAGSRVLALSAFKYYLRSDLLLCASKHEEYSALQPLSFQDINAFWTEVYRQGYQYVVYEKLHTSQHLRFGIEPDPNKTPPWLKLEALYGKPGDDIVSYKINVYNPPVKIESTCVENEPGTWEVQSLTNAKK